MTTYTIPVHPVTKKNSMQIIRCKGRFIPIPAKERLKQQISRIHKSEYRKVLILRYIERWKWIDIINECFWYEEDLNYNFEKYKTKIMYWNRSALEKLEELSTKPYIPEQIKIGLI